MECSGRSRVAAGGLNPLASVFVPKACSHATVRASTAGTDPQGDARGFGQLPDEVSFLRACIVSSLPSYQTRTVDIHL